MNRVLLLLSFGLVLLADQPLLSHPNSCIREVVSSFVRAEDCGRLSDQSKSKLALKMTECLLVQMGRPFPSRCGQVPSTCGLEGDAWNTFSTFFAHVDNLCHFYWQTLHHQRAERLISDLSTSSSRAQQVLMENAQETRRLSQLQQQMQGSINQSLESQQKMASLVETSTARIGNLTVQLETSVGQIQRQIEQSYASVRGVLTVVSEGVQQISVLQHYLKAEVTSLSGAIFFLCQLLSGLLLTSMPQFRQQRPIILTISGVQLIAQLTLASVIQIWPGMRLFRCLCILAMALTLSRGASKERRIEEAVSNALNTPRLTRVLSRAAHQQRSQDWEGLGLSCLAEKVVERLERRSEHLRLAVLGEVSVG